MVMFSVKQKRLLKDKSNIGHSLLNPFVAFTGPVILDIEIDFKGTCEEIDVRVEDSRREL